MEKSQGRNRRSRCICRFDNIYREVFTILLELPHSYTYGVSKPYTTENFSILKLNFLDFCKSESNRISYLYFKTMCKIMKKLRVTLCLRGQHFMTQDWLIKTNLYYLQLYLKSCRKSIIRESYTGNLSNIADVIVIAINV